MVSQSNTGLSNTVSGQMAVFASLAEAIRDNLPPNHEAELKIRGDDVFGRRLTITYFRDQTQEEAELEAKYSEPAAEDPTIEQLKRKLDEVPFKLGTAKRR